MKSKVKGYRVEGIEVWGLQIVIALRLVDL